MRKLIFILFYATVHTAHAILPPPNNAVSLSLGGASATYTNAFAIENNVAALAKTNGELSLNASNMDIWFRYAHSRHDTPITSLTNDYTIGSGLEETAGNQKQTFTLQVRYLIK